MGWYRYDMRWKRRYDTNQSIKLPENMHEFEIIIYIQVIVQVYFPAAVLKRWDYTVDVEMCMYRRIMLLAHFWSFQVGHQRRVCKEIAAGNLVKYCSWWVKGPCYDHFFTTLTHLKLDETFILYKRPYFSHQHTEIWWSNLV